MIIIIFSSLFVLSFLWAVFSLYKEEKTHSQISHVKTELQKEKILFRS
jgi:hypothetical protein